MHEPGPDGQTAFTSSVRCPYGFPAVVLTHTTKLFRAQKSVATIHLNSGETLPFANANPASTQVAASLDNRGPPSLIL